MTMMPVRPVEEIGEPPPPGQHRRGSEERGEDDESSLGNSFEFSEPDEDMKDTKIFGEDEAMEDAELFADGEASAAIEYEVMRSPEPVCEPCDALVPRTL